MELEGISPETPPVPVRLAMFAGYVYAYILGFRCLCSPFGTLEATSFASANAVWSVVYLTLIYAVDATLAASPLHWCCMRSIPPKNVLQHHLPFVVGMLPTVMLYVKYYDDFYAAVNASPVCCLYMAAGCLTSSNEALWVGSSFFTSRMLASKSYRVGQKLMAFVCLSQFILVGGIGALGSAWEMARYIRAGELVFVRGCMVVPCTAFVVVVPFVQVPLLKGAWGRLLDAVNEKDVSAKAVKATQGAKKKAQ